MSPEVARIVAELRNRAIDERRKGSIATMHASIALHEAARQIEAGTFCPVPEVKRLLRDMTAAELDALPVGARTHHPRGLYGGMTKDAAGRWVFGDGSAYDTSAGLLADTGNYSIERVTAPE